MKRSAVGMALLVVGTLSIQLGEAHKGITSKFTYNAEVYPIFVSRCGRCHVDGAVGPMSLLKYEDAYPWAESLRTELLAASGEETPSPRRSAEAAEAGDFIRAAHRQISARELDIILDWATGGTPEGDKAQTPTSVVYSNEWSRGKPDLMIPMSQSFELTADAFEKTEEFVLPVTIEQPRSVGQIDVLPGNPAIVRSATILMRSKEGDVRALGTWFPRQTPIPLAVKPVARLEPGSELIARVHYKKTWKFEGKAMSDRSTVGLYYAD
jgi:hypothetical protein